MNRDLIINFTPTGMVPTTNDTPHVPVEISDIVEQSLLAAELGASIIHLHARDELEKPSSCPDLYQEIIEKIRRFNKELIICVSLSGRINPSPEIRGQVLDLDGDSKPDMGSLTLSSLNFPRSASLNSPDTIKALAGNMKKKGIAPELEVFDLGMVNAIRYLDERGYLHSKKYVNCILGNIYGLQATPTHIANVIHDVGAECTLAFGGIGRQQFTSNIISIAFGHHVRVGLEDNIWYDTARKNLATNEALIRRVISLAHDAERMPMPPRTVREALALNPGNGKYGVKDYDAKCME